MSKESLNRTVVMAGGQVALAVKLSSVMDRAISQGHVWQWLNNIRGETPPANYVIPICKAVDWKITPHELRPDIYPSPNDGLSSDKKTLRCISQK